MVTTTVLPLSFRAAKAAASLEGKAQAFPSSRNLVNSQERQMEAALFMLAFGIAMAAIIFAGRR